MEIPDDLKDQELIFHFTKSKIAIENILFDGRIRFSPLKHMNDPYEYKIISSAVQPRGGICENVAHQVSEILKEVIRVDSKLLCFVGHKNCECDAFELPFIKPRSWAQYGEEQYGVCLVFRKNSLLETIKMNIKDVSIFEDTVVYDLDTKSRSKKNFITYKPKQSVEENVRQHLEQHKQDIYFRKYRDFRDENEYRIVLVDNTHKRPGYIYCPIKGALHSVILGDRFHDVYIGVIKELANKLDAKTFALRYGREPNIIQC